MKIDTIISKLKGTESDVNRMLKYLSKRCDQQNLISGVLPELKALMKNSKIRPSIENIIFQQTMTDWYKSFYDIRDEFYYSLDSTIEEIGQELVRIKGNKVRLQNLKPRIKRFLKHLGKRELDGGLILTEYVNLSVRMEVRQLLGSHYVPILKVMENYEIIEIRADYSSDIGYSRGYRVHRKWIHQHSKESNHKNFKDFPILESTNEVLQKVNIDYPEAMAATTIYCDVRLLKDRIPIKDRKPIVHEGRLSKISLLTDDKKSGKTYLKDYYNFPTAKLDKNYKHQIFLHKGKLIGSPLTRYEDWKRREVANIYTNQIVRIYNQDESLVYGTDGRRIYTAISSLPKRLIRHIRIDGDKLIERDLANAQWRILIYCFENPQLNNLASIYARVRGTDFMNNPDFVEAKEAICKGKFYEHIQEKAFEDTLMKYFFYGQSLQHIHPGKLQKLKRAATKMLTFLVLFSSHEFEPPVKQEFKKHFPTLAKVCDDMKNPKIYLSLFPVWKKENASYFNEYYGGVQPTNEEIYKELPKELQRVEGNIVVNTVLKQLHKNGIDALTKHDALLIPSSQLEVAEGIIYQQLDNIFQPGSYVLS